MSRDARSRRTVLELAGTATLGLVLAGCGGPEDDVEPDAEEGTGNGQDAADDDEHAADEDDQNDSDDSSND